MKKFLEFSLVFLFIVIIIASGCSYSNYNIKGPVIKPYESKSIKIPRAEYLYLKGEGIYVPKYYLANDTKFIEDTFKYDNPENTIYAYLTAIVNRDVSQYLNSFTERRKDVESESERAIGDLPDKIFVNYSININQKDKETYDAFISEVWDIIDNPYYTDLNRNVYHTPLVEHVILKNMNGYWKIDFVGPHNYTFAEYYSSLYHKSSGESEKFFTFQTKENDCKTLVIDKGFPIRHCIPFYINEGSQNIVVYNDVKTDYFDLDGDNFTDLVQLSIHESGIAAEYKLLFMHSGLSSENS